MVTCFFWTLQDAMDCADEFFKFLCKYLLENRHEDMIFIAKRVDKTITTRLEATASNSLLRLSYTEAISTLQKVTSTFKSHIIRYLIMCCYIIMI